MTLLTKSFYLMFDHEKGCMIYKDGPELVAWRSKCKEIVLTEYGKATIDAFEKWRKDGERFLKEDFLNSASFPFLNDGRPELMEWLEGTLQTMTLEHYWDYESRLKGAYEFLESMEKAYYSGNKQLKPAVHQIDFILTNLRAEREFDSVDDPIE